MDIRVRQNNFCQIYYTPEVVYQTHEAENILSWLNEDYC